MQTADIIDTVDLFPKLDAKLIEVLRTLTAEDWERPTPAPQWRVKDVAGHLLDGNLRALSMLRDEYTGTKAPEINSYGELVQYLNRLNAEWLVAMKRLSPAVIIELLEQTGIQYCAWLKTLDPMAKAAFAVAWAGEETSRNWFHVARDYTEKWHHQQQIRAAVGQEEELYADELFQPYLETSMRALPYHYRHVEASAGTVIKFVVSGDRDYVWFLQSDEGTWQLVTTTDRVPSGEIVMSREISWRIFTKAVTPEEASKRVTSRGNTALAEKVVEMLAVMA